MWIEIPKENKVITDESSGLYQYPEFLESIQQELKAVPGSVLMIECKNEYDSEKPASAYEIAQLLGISTALPVSVEGHGISPFLNALYIASLHLRANTSSVIIVAKPPSGGTLEHSDKDRTSKETTIVKLSLKSVPQNPCSIHAVAIPFTGERIPPSLSDYFTNINFFALQAAPNCKWLLKELSIADREKLTSFDSNRFCTINDDHKSCFDLLKGLSNYLSTGIILQREDSEGQKCEEQTINREKNTNE
ncbi:hypothetical protein [Maridesulfovibrio hydrothermalis]|uniref:Uncharacterized protein n=1 Tax=Maridesulfovibrio hydrothermalis AM13 = DSM 14728 TaxID=1121451 RepID=L0R9P0_9BACT|nr:hypothetical protein [Maridesulfovibrio hydrothermalis]CCO22311.1 protein of unknown function [Maridesulfovibrio hydrothermalis AM13 = DSM 14728]